MNLVNDVKYTFKNPTESYDIAMDPINVSMDQYQRYLEAVYKVPASKSLEITKKLIKRNNPVNPIVHFNRKKENGDMERVEDTLGSYIKDTIAEGELIVPSFTTYIHPSKKKSLQAEYLFINVKKRSEDKKKSFEYKQLGDKAKALYYGTMQKIRKIFNNAVSGAYGSKGSILSNPSGHYTLTSITRCVASIGNMTTESMVAGNKYFKDSKVTINYLLAVMQITAPGAVRRCIDKFNLHIPTADEVMEMLLFSTRWYWTNVEHEKTIYNLICSMTEEERCSVMYVNDLWHLKKYNDKLMRDILKGMGSKSEIIEVEDPVKVLYGAPEGIITLVHAICSEEIRGMEVNYKNMVGTKTLAILASTAVKIMRSMDDYFLLFKVFYTKDILPTSIAYIRDMLRDSIVLSDTDSTCGSYDKWIEWYYGENVFTPESIGIANAVMMINTQVMDHHIKILAANMNIDKSMYETLKMKNEFYWSVFIATNVSKHYYAYVDIQEGNVYAESELELKGVHLIASNIKIEIKKLIHKIMIDLLEAIKNKNTISLKYYVKETVRLEKMIIDSIRKNDVSYFKRMPIKGATSYKNKAEESPYQYHTLWEDIFSEKYGSLGEPPYMFVKIPLNINNKTEMNAFLESIEDQDIKRKFTELFTKKNISKYTTIRMPLDIVMRKGIPEEIVDHVAVARIIDDSLYSLYMVLETLGYYKKPGLQVYQQAGVDEQ